MSQQLPVTDGDKLDAWLDYHARPDIAHLPVRLPVAGFSADDLMLAGLQRVLEGDRKRVRERNGV